MNHEYQYLVGKLQEALARDERVGALDIRINIVHGRVHLTGQVPTEERRESVHRSPSRPADLSATGGSPAR